MTDSSTLLHLHPGAHWHEPGYIVGNRQGLIALREAIDAALRGGVFRPEVEVNDGEGYVLEVQIDESDSNERGSTWWRRAKPYTDPVACCGNDEPGTIWPWTAVEQKAEG